jgi:hypothetical protein
MKTKVVIREFERGWGNKIDEVKEFDSYGEAVSFCAEFNKDNNLDYVPDWYMTAEIVKEKITLHYGME